MTRRPPPARFAVANVSTDICNCERRSPREGFPISDQTAQQIALYGEPLAQRFGRVLAAYAIPQSRLAAVIGLSAPMLSQLASAQRAKISNPAVYARLLRLEELAPGIDSPARAQAVLDEVAASSPQLTSEFRGDDLSARLRSLATSAELHAAAAAVPGSRLASALRTAAGPDPR